MKQKIEPQRIITEEFIGLVDKIEIGLLELQAGNGDADTVININLILHNISDMADHSGLKNVQMLSQSMIDMFNAITQGSLVINDELIEILLSANKILKDMLVDVNNSEYMNISEHITKISSVLSSQSMINDDVVEILGVQVLTNGEENIKVNPTGVDKISEFYVNDVMDDNTQQSGEEGKLINETSSCQPLLWPPLFKQTEVSRLVVDSCVSGIEAAEVLEIETAKYPCINSDDTVRMHISLLNDLLNLAGEMVLGRNQLLRTLEAYRKKIPGLNSVLQNINNITTELQEKIMQTRMQPVSKLFDKFPRIIRELSKKMDKDINLRMEGMDVELDKSIIEALVDPLVHLVRNAVDHGIEMPDIREKAGKSRTGTIFLKAYHESGHVNIDIIDDGAGINVENIKQQALQKGLIRPEEALWMGERALLTLLFLPGFTTVSKVTDLSGRGVGLDVVKTNIEKLGGLIEIMTKYQQNTTFRLTLPLTLAIIPSIIVEVEGQKFALSQVNLQEMVRIKPDDPRKIEMLGGFQVMRLRGSLLPIVHLASVLGLKETGFVTNQVIRILVIKSGSKRFGLIVDYIHDGEEILVKRLPRYLSSCKCYSGVTIMGDGRTAMILDPEGIAVKAGLRFLNESQEKAITKDVPSFEHMSERQSLLLFKCSGSEIFSIDLSMVARVEKIKVNQIEKVGEKEFIQFRGEALKVIRPENYLPVIQHEKSVQTLYVIIPKLVKHPIGILIEEILDIIETQIKFNREDVKAKGLVGTANLQNRMVLVINIYELFEMASPEHYRVESSDEENKNGIIILLAEDTPFFAKIEKKYLESSGYHVILVSNGKEAWEVLQQNHVDILVSDIEMPLMDGYELVKRVRRDDRLAKLPVIALTSRTDDRSIRKGIDAGFDYYEIKLDKDRLLEKIKLVLLKK